MFACWPVSWIAGVSLASGVAISLASSACARLVTESARERPAAPPPASSAAPRDHSWAAMNQGLADRFPGAAVLGEAEFADAVVGRKFRYRVVESGLVVERPNEVFLAGGQYQLHRLRSVSYGTYAVGRGIVSIDCSDCPSAFIGLGRDRVFFRHRDRLFAMNANGEGQIIELLQES